MSPWRVYQRWAAAVSPPSQPGQSNIRWDKSGLLCGLWYQSIRSFCQYCFFWFFTKTRPILFLKINFLRHLCLVYHSIDQHLSFIVHLFIFVYLCIVIIKWGSVRTHTHTFARTFRLGLGNIQLVHIPLSFSYRHQRPTSLYPPGYSWYKR